MGRKRKSREDLPKNVYEYKTKKRGLKYRGVITETGEDHRYVGPFDTPEEAEYKLSVAKFGNHWGIPMDDEPSYFGFIYIVEERKTGRQYVGKKQCYYWDGPAGGYKCQDPTDEEWFDPLAWKSGNFQLYTTSSDEINEIIAKGNPWDFKYRVVATCQNGLELHKMEMGIQEGMNVLEETMDNGEYKFFNKNIAGLAFRAPFRKLEMLLASEKTAEVVRNYYLKPQLDTNGTVIPFEKRDAPKYRLVDNTRETLSFEDVT